MKVRLTKKHAECIDGVDLRGHEPGDLLDLPVKSARLLLAEEWAVRERRQHSDGSAPRRRADDYRRGAA
jgi:hypothetical protein